MTSIYIIVNYDYEKYEDFEFDHSVDGVGDECIMERVTTSKGAFATLESCLLGCRELAERELKDCEEGKVIEKWDDGYLVIFNDDSVSFYRAQAMEVN